MARQPSERIRRPAPEALQAHEPGYVWQDGVCRKVEGETISSLKYCQVTLTKHIQDTLSQCIGGTNLQIEKN